MNFKPVIFLAFANDKVDNTAYLRNLSLEQHGIRKALAEAVSSGLCEIIERSSARISDIIDVFQDPIYGQRISIFHYGGHANGFSLLLESDDGSKSITHKEGLIPFFARQENLKLIFLNGCSSEGQANDLLKAGIPAVIGTTASINDEIATGLAIRFYSSLGDGSSISKAWADATDEIKIKHGTGNTRALHWAGKEEVTDRFPWVIQFKAGAEIIKDWNLPDISGNPLYGLPSIPPSFNLPESPFLYLNRYERKHAEVYFGRSYFVRSLFWSVMDHQSPPIILLCGQSGTGKSSLLEAGLQPRLESKYDIIYLRRNGTLGLSTTLFNALLEKSGFTPTVRVISESKTYSELETLKEFVSSLSDTIKSQLQPIIEKLSTPIISQEVKTPIQDQRPETILTAWKLVESKSNKPLLIILDQLEEAYTRPNAALGNEMKQLFLDLKSSFGNPTTLPQGKILLSYRKEYQAEIEEHCKKYELPRSKVFIEHISKSDILELFHGFIQSARLKSRYNLTIEDGLPEIIAEDLAADKDTPIAPMLQVLLTKMWNKASASKTQSPAFTHSLYKEIKEEGLAMDEFLSNQIQSIKKKLPEQVDSGLVLDMLAFHCTSNSTSAARAEKELNERYPFAKAEADKVLAACKDYFLITDIGGTDRNAMLAHDTLAKSVVKAQLKSTLPIQQGKRILGSRLEAIKAGSAFAIMDSWELKLIEKIQTYLPAFNEDEKKLFDTSRKEIKKQERLKKAIVNSGRIITALSILTGIVAWYLFAKSIKHEKDSFVTMAALTSNMHITKDPSLAIRQALDGLRIDSSNIELKKVLLNAYYFSKDNKVAWYKNMVEMPVNFSGLRYHRGTKSSILLSQKGTLLIIDSLGKKTDLVTDMIYEKSGEFKQVQWGRDGQSIITLNQAGKIGFWNRSGNPLTLYDTTSYTSFDYSDSSDVTVVFSQEDQWIKLSNQYGVKIDSLELNKNSRDKFTTHVKLHPSGKGLITANVDLDEDNPSHYQLNFIDLKGNVFFSNSFESKYSSGIGDIYISNSGEYIGANLISDRYDDFLQPWKHKFMIWKKDGKLLNEINVGEENSILDIVFHPQKEYYLVVQKDHPMYSTFSKKSKRYTFNDENKMNDIRFSPSSDFILTAGTDNIGKIWNLDGCLNRQLLGHTLPVTGIDIDLNEQKAISISSDGTFKLWNLEDIESGYELDGKFTEFFNDPNRNLLFIPGAGVGSKIYDLRIKSERRWPSLDSSYEGRRQKWWFLDTNLIISTNLNQTEIFNPWIKTSIKLPMHDVFHIGLVSNYIIISSKSEISFWNREGQKVKTISADTTANEFKLNKFNTATISNDQSLIASIVCVGDGSASDSCYLQLYDQHGKKIKNYGNELDNRYRLLFTHDDKHIILYSDFISILDLESKNAVVIKPLDCDAQNDPKCRLRNVHVSNNSNLISSSKDGMIKIWNMQGDLVRAFQSNALNLQDANFTPDGSLIYSYDIDSTLDLWTLQGSHIYKYDGHTAFFTTDGNELYTIRNYRTELPNSSFAFGYGNGLVRYLTPNGSYNYFKCSSTFSYKKDNSLRAKWKRILEWLRLG